MVTARALAVEDLADTVLPKGWELADGQFAVLSCSSRTSARIGGRISTSHWRYGEETGLGFAHHGEAEQVLRGDRQDRRSPDAAFVVWDRLPTEPGGFVSVVPDLAVEVLSSADRMAYTLAKIVMHLTASVRMVWLVDPSAQTILVFRPEESATMLSGDDGFDGGDILPGLHVPVAPNFE